MYLINIDYKSLLLIQILLIISKYSCHVHTAQIWGPFALVSHIFYSSSLPGTETYFEPQSSWLNLWHLVLYSWILSSASGWDATYHSLPMEPLDFLMSPWLPYPRQIRPPLALSLTKLQFNMLLCKLQFELLTSLPVLLNHASCPSLQAVFEIIVHLKVKLTQDTACSIIVIKHTKLKIHSPALNELIIFIK